MEIIIRLLGGDNIFDVENYNGYNNNVTWWKQHKYYYTTI